jgi:hypothetical protein
MLRSAAFILGGLFILSSTYYLTFWSRFNIDIFQYMQVGDIVKGVAYPMREVAAWYLGSVCLLMISVPFALLSPEIVEIRILRRVIRTLGEESEIIYMLMKVALLIMFVSALSILIANYNVDVYFSDIATVVFALASASYSMVCYIAFRKFYSSDQKELRSVVANKNVTIFGKILGKITGHSEIEIKKSDDSFEIIANHTIISTFVYFLICVGSVGWLDSAKIINDIEYDYVKNIEVKNDTTIYHYNRLLLLGSFGDKFIFLKRNKENNSYLVISKEKLPIVEVYHYKRVQKSDVDKQPCQ